MIRDSIDANNGRFAAALRHGASPEAAAVYADDAALLAPNAERITGREAIADFWQAAIDTGVCGVDLETVEFPYADGFACEVGNHRLHIQPEGGEPVTDLGKYVVIHRHRKWGPPETWVMNALRRRLLAAAAAAVASVVAGPLAVYPSAEAAPRIERIDPPKRAVKGTIGPEVTREPGAFQQFGADAFVIWRAAAASGEVEFDERYSFIEATSYANANAGQPGGGYDQDHAEKEKEGAGPWTESVSVSSSASGSAQSASGSAMANQSSSATVTDGVLSVDASGSIHVTAGASGPQAGGSGAGSSELSVSFEVIGSPVSYTLSGSLTDPAHQSGGSIEVKLRCGTKVHLQAVSDSQSAFSGSGTLAGGCVLAVQSVVGTTTSDAPSATGSFDLSFRAGGAPSDTGAPEAIIDQAPSGAGNPPDASILFHSTEPDGATFRCSLDAGPASACSSPHAISNLAPGHHNFAVTALDAAGNESAPAQASWEVGSVACATAIPIGFAKACGTGLVETEAGSKIFKTPNLVWVGGFEIRPRPEGRLVVDQNTTALREEGTGVEVVFAGRVVPIPLHLIPVGSASADVGFGGAGSLSLYGLPIEAEAKVIWTDGGASSDFEVGVKTDDLAAALGEVISVGSSVGVGEAELELKAKQENGKGFQLTGAKVEAETDITILPASLLIPRQLKLKNVGLSYELRDGKDFWVGQVGVELPFGQSGLDVTGKLSIFDGGFAGAGLKLDGFNRPIGTTGLFFQSIEGELLFRPSFGFDLGIGGTVGPRIADVALVDFTANVRGLALALGCTSGQDPIEFTVTGEIGALERLGVGESELEGTHCLYASSLLVEVKDKIAVGFGGEGDDLLGFEAELSGFISKTGANLEGTGTVKLPALPDLSGNELVSTTGIAACADLGLFSGGFGYAWGTTVPSAFSGCDLSPWRATVSARSASQRLGPAATATVRVASGLPLVGFRAAGANAAPRLRVSGPTGKRFESPQDGGLLKTSEVLIARVPQELRTYVFVRRPAAGEWTVESLDADNPIGPVSASRGLPAPKVKARVLRPRKGSTSHTLRYTANRIPGQRIEVTERASGLAHRLGTITKSHGTIRFRPGSSSDRTREVEALVIQNGIPRALLTIARFRAPVPKAPPAPRKLKAKRKGGTIAITFNKVRGARSYLVDAKQGKTSLATLLSSKPSAKLTGVPAGKLTITVRAIVSTASRGRAAKVTVR